MPYVSKMIPASDKGGFFAFRQVFSRKASTGSRVRIMGPNYVPGQKKDLYVKSVQRRDIWMGKIQEAVKDVPGLWEYSGHAWIGSVHHQECERAGSRCFSDQGDEVFCIPFRTCCRACKILIQ
ncbi:unnamed protein product [Musa hybrid cultivar]